mmetsp:Transcript_27573/g.59894  ORF Transcript_27573/g.59894 Transcript_27573/m.59894 type:complete len:233 (-) Transcript_27573:41-739(-)
MHIRRPRGIVSLPSLYICLLLLWTGDAAVQCGAHKADSCSQCPGSKGAVWCNGDCRWVDGLCLAVNDTVNCGRKFATSCSQCTTGDHGDRECAGDCYWTGTQCLEVKVSCGAHRAPSCDLCPQGHGESWCHGNCTWLEGQCLAYEDTVQCGAHRARSCSQCPQGNGERWCNGECTWKGGACVAARRMTATEYIEFLKKWFQKGLEYFEVPNNIAWGKCVALGATGMAILYLS